MVTRGNIAHISQLLPADGGDWAKCKEDHNDAYKQLPIGPAGKADSIVAPRRPVESRRYGFVSRTQIFGSGAAVLRYNVLSRLLTALDNRYMGIPMIGYFDDFSEIIRSRIGQAPIDTFKRFYPFWVFS